MFDLLFYLTVNNVQAEKAQNILFKTWISWLHRVYIKQNIFLDL